MPALSSYSEDIANELEESVSVVKKDIYRTSRKLRSRSITIFDSVKNDIGINSRILQLLSKFSSLEHGWDGDDGQPPSPAAILYANYLCKLLGNRGIKIYHSAPGPRGEIMLDIRAEKGSRSVEIILYSDRAFAVMIDPTMLPTQNMFQIDDLNKYIKFLNNE